MERIQQKEREKVDALRRQKQLKLRQVTKQFFADDTIKIVIDYCQKILSSSITEDLTEYSPSTLSKFIFEKQLEEIKKCFARLPNQECIIDHFLLIMIKVMKFSFDKWPYFLVGFKQMFFEIASKKNKSINYQQFFRYVIGEVLDFKEEEHNTQFQVRFQELKVQDYLLHDNGIKKFYYSNDLKSFFTLDESTYMIKIYNKNMKLASKFIPNKQKHNKKLPKILWFDYSELTKRLALTFNDQTISVINLNTFLTKSRGQFDTNPTNQLVVSLQQKTLKIFYIQMLNKWALFTQQNKFHIFDQQKYKQNDPNYLTTIKMQNPDLLLTQIVELVNSSMICVIAGNQIYFYNENFTEKKHSLFSHSSNITNFHYSQETDSFYVCGLEKDITVFSIPRGSDNFKIKSLGIPIKNKIKSFQIFPAMNSLLVTNQIHQVQLFDLSKGTCYQMVDYSQIVKNQENYLKTLYISKNQFAIYETYTLLFQQQKIAIERDIQFSFLSDTYYDEAKQQFYFSVNQQIISFSLVQGEIRKNFNNITSNIQKIQSFKVGKTTDIFVIDQDKYIYEAYLRDSMPDGEYKSYKKKLNTQSILSTFYDQQTQYLFVISPSSLTLIKNDKYNNFNINSSLITEQLPPIVLAQYNQHQKQITIMLQNQCWLVIDPCTLKINQIYSIVFPVDNRDHQEELVIRYLEDAGYDMDIILTNKNKIYLVSKIDRQCNVQVRLEDVLARRERALNFIRMEYFGEFKHHMKQTLILCDSTGYMLELDITKIVGKYFKKSNRDIINFGHPIKDTRNVLLQNLWEPTTIKISQNIAKLQKKNMKLIKAHEKQIKIVQLVYLQGLKILSISLEGLIKLWQGQKTLFELKLPDLKKMQWDMKQIQNIKNMKSVKQVISIIDNMKFMAHEKKSPQKLLQFNDPALNMEKQLKKFNYQEPITIQIDNKDLEDLVHKTQQINWYNTARSSSKKKSIRDQSPTVTNFHPWRTRNSFLKIMQKASPDNKYQRKMPFDLINLRNSLDMQDRKQLTSRKEQQKKQLFILPELNSYVAEKKPSQEKLELQNANTKVEQENQETFESCVYVKRTKNHKKLNQFDQIDKQFKKKWVLLTAKKWVPSKDKRRSTHSQYKSNRTSKMQLNYAPTKQQKYDPIKKVKEIFESHNKEVASTKKGRFIKIPELSLRREDLFPE